MRSGLVLAIAAMVMLACPSHANAQTATWTDPGSGVEYTFVSGSYYDNYNILQKQTWWGDGAAASAVARTVGLNLGSTSYWSDAYSLYPRVVTIAPLVAYDFSAVYPSPNPVNYYPDDPNRVTAYMSYYWVSGTNMPSPPNVTQSAIDSSNHSWYGFWPQYSGYSYVVTTASMLSIASVPEIDGSKLPIAGFVLGTFMLWMFARRRREQQDSVGSLSFA